MSVEMLLIVLLAMAAGGAIGYTIGKKRSPTTALEQQLAQSKEQLQNYQRSVTEHFAETAQRVNRLTAQYQDVHDYLAASAMRLANPELDTRFLATPTTPLDESEGLTTADPDVSAAVAEAEESRDGVKPRQEEAVS